ITKARGKGLEIVSPESFEAVSGHGLRAIHANQNIMIGNRKMMQDFMISIDDTTEAQLSQLEQDGKTAVIVSIDNRLSGIIAISDTIKAGAKEVVDKLKSQSIEPIMLTGDNERTAKAVASKIGMDRVIAQVLPHQKEEIISDLKT